MSEEPTPEKCQTCGGLGGVVLSYRDGPGLRARWVCPYCVNRLERELAEAERCATRAAVEECCRLVCDACEHGASYPHVSWDREYQTWAKRHCYAVQIREHFREVLGSENVVSSEEG